MTLSVRACDTNQSFIFLHRETKVLSWRMVSRRRIFYGVLIAMTIVTVIAYSSLLQSGYIHVPARSGTSPVTDRGAITLGKNSSTTSVVNSGGTRPNLLNNTTKFLNNIISADDDSDDSGPSRSTTLWPLNEPGRPSRDKTGGTMNDPVNNNNNNVVERRLANKRQLKDNVISTESNLKIVEDIFNTIASDGDGVIGLETGQVVEQLLSVPTGQDKPVDNNDSNSNIISPSLGPHSEETPVTTAAIVVVKKNPPRRDVPQRKGVLIMASARTGSSFLGEIFNHNPHFFYIFEPLFAIFADRVNGNRHYTPRDVRVNGMVSQFISEYFRCEFKNDHVANLFQHPQMWHAMVSHSVVLSKADVCGGSSGRQLWEGAKICRIYDIRKVSKTCKNQKHVATKVIRVVDVALLLPFLRLESIDGHIIHLMRDPRSSIFSRTKMYGKEQVRASLPALRQFASETCEEYRTQMKSVLQRSAALTGKYALLRFEDLAMDPMAQAKLLYDWIGLDLHKDVVDWLSENTKYNNMNFYTTTRNSQQAATKWRYTIPYAWVGVIQEECSDILKQFGYAPITEERQLYDAKYPVFIDQYEMKRFTIAPMKGGG